MPGKARLAVVVAAILLVATASVPIRHYVLPEIVSLAYTIEKRDIAYSWGGGHADRPGPSKGTCEGYRGRIKPCPATRTRGLDCSGFVR